LILRKKNKQPKEPMDKIREVNRETLEGFMKSGIDTKVSMFNQHLDLVKMMVNTMLDEEVNDLAGEKYCRNKPHEGQYSRWGYNPGSVKVGVQKVPIQVPRIFDNKDSKNRSLETYEQLHELSRPSEELIASILHGLSLRDYPQVIQKLNDSFGLSAATLSQQFVKASTAALKVFNERDLSEINFVALFIDGKYLAKQQMVIVLGVTEKGDKIPIGLTQTTTENSLAIKQLLSELIGRGLDFQEGLLAVIDGSKGLNKAVKETFGNKAIIQRCTWHKRENVVSYLKVDTQKYYRQKMQYAYSQPEYRLAKAELLNIADDLKKESVSAYNSLMEGFEETLTLQKLELHDFSRSFSTANCIENLNSQIQKYTRKVKHWQTPDQRLRWVAMAILTAELKMKKVGNFKNLNKMKHQIKRHIEKLKEAS
jgi:putative transposase